MSNVKINHEYRLLVDDDINIKNRNLIFTPWGISSRKDLNSLVDHGTYVNESNLKNKHLTAIDALAYENIDIVDLGIYSNKNSNLEFELTYNKEIIHPSSTRYFKFLFLLNKEIVKKYTNIKLEETGRIDQYNYESEETFLRDSYDIDLNIEDISYLRMVISIMLDSASSNGRLRYRRYFLYK